jgi:hypothetical protein
MESAQDGYPSDVWISITAYQTAGRRLWVGQGRLPFFEPHTTQAKSVEVTATLPMDTSGSLPVETATKLLKDFFDRFG